MNRPLEPLSSLGPPLRHPGPFFTNGLPAPGIRNLPHQLLPDADSLARVLQPLGTLLHLQRFDADGDGAPFVGQLSINALPLLSFSAAGMQCELDPTPTVMVAACIDGRPLG